MNILFLAQEFYALEAITALLSANQCGNLDDARHSHIRWYNDFTDFRIKFIDKFASAIFDYTVCVVAAELRHCNRHASHVICDYFSTDLSRDETFIECKDYRPSDILSAGLRMFDTDRVKWGKGFGGDKWMQIARAGLMKGTVSDCVFIDHCVDLSHNNSVYFDKGAGIFMLGCRENYRVFLDNKRYCEPGELLSEKHGHMFDRLLLRANNLGITTIRATTSTSSSERTKAESLVLDYHPVEWGNLPLDYSEDQILNKFSFVSGDYGNRRNAASRNYARCA